jgi:hypothetical protein
MSRRTSMKVVTCRRLNTSLFAVLVESASAARPTTPPARPGRKDAGSGVPIQPSTREPAHPSQDPGAGAKKWHPDVNYSPGAAETFKRLEEAAALLRRLGFL